VRRRRTAAAGAAVVVVLVAAGILLTPGLTRNRAAEPAQPSPTGAPAVAMTYDDDSEGTKVIWAGAERHVTAIPDTTPVATVPGGLLLVSGHDLLLLPENGARRTLVTGLNSEGVAVSPDGRLATVVTTVAGRRRLTEIDIGAGQIKRWVPLGPPLVTDDEPLAPGFYSSDAVVLNIGDGKRAAVWEPGPGQIVGRLDTYTSVVGGGRLGAVAMAQPDTCTAIGTMGAAFTPWEACGLHFIGFSADGASALVLNNEHSSAFVADTGDREQKRTLDLPDHARTIGWESDDTFLYAAVRDPENVVVRCTVSTTRCEVADRVAGQLPRPLPNYGPVG
jgi:hypothetical protein